MAIFSKAEGLRRQQEFKEELAEMSDEELADIIWSDFDESFYRDDLAAERYQKLSGFGRLATREAARRLRGKDST